MRLKFPILLLFCCFQLISVSDLVAQLAANVSVARQQDDSVGVISIRWDASAEKAWHEANDGHLDIPGLKTSIHSSSLSKSTTTTTTNTYQFDLPTDAMIEMIVGDIDLVFGEQLHLLDMHGKVLFDFSTPNQKRVLTPSFDPASTILVWKCPEGSGFQSTFSIDKIYYQYVSPQRTRGIGFGTALPCHPNTACKQDSIIELIANSAVRMRMVMEEGIGWCTGAFINTTRNDKTPYLLSAYHCQYDYTPIYDMWRFDLQYKSTTCDQS